MRPEGFGDFVRPTASIESFINAPVVREIVKRQPDTELNLSHYSNVDAAIVQARGELAIDACKRCVEGRGPFTECVAAEGTLKGSCANCHYGRQGTQCSFRETAEERVTNRGNARRDSQHRRGHKAAESEKRIKRTPVNTKRQLSKRTRQFLASVEQNAKKQAELMNLQVEIMADAMVVAKAASEVQSSLAAAARALADSLIGGDVEDGDN
ncbi:hypothetical protein FQN49_004205 [Arthroderma sp. PD_2]|nr:hypothetical protein FQN49_004205 [Arthroderma sp. PD_2]